MKYHREPTHEPANARSRLTKKQEQGRQSRELILDTAEKLMGTRGYAATAISDISKACGLPASSLYWHFGSKEGLLAAVLQRGAEQFFAAIPTAEQAATREELPQRLLMITSGLLSERPEFLRLFYLLSLEHNGEPVAGVLRHIRDTAIQRFRDVIAHQLPTALTTAQRERITNELTTFAVALSDGVFFAVLLEPETTDTEKLYRRLGQALAALASEILKELQ